MSYTIHLLDGTSPSPRLAAALAFRSRHFRGRADPDADRDRHDPHWHHLVVEDENGAIRGYARLGHHAPEDLAALSYAARFFAIETVAPAAPLFEIGRVVVEGNDLWARQTLIRLLFAAIVKLAEETGAARLWGCVSLPRPLPPLPASLPRPLPLLVGPGPAPGRMARLWAAVPAAPPAERAGASPGLPLLAAYLAAGAALAPAIVADPDLGNWVALACLDRTAPPTPPLRRLQRLATTFTIRRDGRTTRPLPGGSCTCRPGMHGRRETYTRTDA